MGTQFLQDSGGREIGVVRSMIRVEEIGLPTQFTLTIEGSTPPEKGTRLTLIDGDGKSEPAAFMCVDVHLSEKCFRITGVQTRIDADGGIDKSLGDYL